MTTTPGTEPTQVQRPTRSVLRTALQVGIPAIFLLPTLIQYAIEELGPQLPPAATAWLVAAGAVVTAIAALIARIMAHPTVELWLRSLPGAAFAAQPRPKPVDREGGYQRPLEALAIAAAAVVFILVVIWIIR
jgi:hypothetical protein